MYLTNEIHSKLLTENISWQLTTFSFTLRPALHRALKFDSTYDYYAVKSMMRMMTLMEAIEVKRQSSYWNVQGKS